MPCLCRQFSPSFCRLFKIFSLIWISSEFHFYISGYRSVFVIPVWDSSGFLKLRTCVFQQYWTSIGCSTFPKFRVFHSCYPLLLAFCISFICIFCILYQNISCSLLYSSFTLLRISQPFLYLLFWVFLFFRCVIQFTLSYLSLAYPIHWFFKINSYIFNFLKFCLILIKYA